MIKAQNYTKFVEFEMHIDTSNGLIDPEKLKTFIRANLLISWKNRLDTDTRYLNFRYAKKHSSNIDMQELEKNLKGMGIFAPDLAARHIASDPSCMLVDFKLLYEPIVIEDGGIWIKTAWLFVLFTMLSGGVDFVKNYESYRAGFAMIMQDLHRGFDFVQISDINEPVIIVKEIEFPSPLLFREGLGVFARREDLYEQLLELDKIDITKFP